MLQATPQALKDSQTPIPNIQPLVHAPFYSWHRNQGLLQANQVSSAPPSQLHGGKEKEKLAGSEDQEKGPEDTSGLSEYQKALQEASKYVMLPYFVPPPNVGVMVDNFTEMLRKKEVFLTELADIQFACKDYETALRQYLGDAEVE
ncbi:hypothetical protein PISMIDRAFT_14360 [Pisolithus microcarpus 441]|uniref:Uncharacterized protein n=1 Tax=Pisolithus microcarpus 441 TaxID=765257 RepID=A0A0C9Y196_9AGAM|nr:hypothetical protein PISMIDRAFT_14360 [Pisolithus microcarpus 441]